MFNLLFRAYLRLNTAEFHQVHLDRYGGVVQYRPTKSRLNNPSLTFVVHGQSRVCLTKSLVSRPTKIALTTAGHPRFKGTVASRFSEGTAPSCWLPHRLRSTEKRVSPSLTRTMFFCSTPSMPNTLSLITSGAICLKIDQILIHDRSTVF